MKVKYSINLWPDCCKTWQRVETKELTPEGVSILLRNLVRNALQGNEVKDVTIVG